MFIIIIIIICAKEIIIIIIIIIDLGGGSIWDYVVVNPGPEKHCGRSRHEAGWEDVE